MATRPSSSSDKSDKNRRSPCPPVITETPDTWALSTSTKPSALAISAKSTTKRAAFCRVLPSLPASCAASLLGKSMRLGCTNYLMN